MAAIDKIDLSKKNLVLTLFILGWLLLPVVSAKAQQRPILEKKVTISANNEPLEIFLRRLSQSAGSVFSYSSSAIDVNKKVTGNFSDQPLREVLEVVFEGNVDIKQKGVYIILIPKPNNQKEVVISGYVVDRLPGRPFGMSLYMTQSR